LEDLRNFGVGGGVWSPPPNPSPSLRHRYTISNAL
jgi:hypothetical protein